MIKIVIVEDHTLFREGLKSLFSTVSDFKVTAEFNNGKEYIDKIFEIDAGVVLMDIEMPVMNGIEATRLSRIKRPDLHILGLSMYSDNKYYYEMINAGVTGFLLKEAHPGELKDAIREVHSGKGYFSQDLLQQVIITLTAEKEKPSLKDNMQLTDREIEILELICKGLTNNEIGDKLFLSPRTVESHKYRIMNKTETKNNAELILFAIKSKLISV